MGKSRHDTAYSWHLSNADGQTVVIPYQPRLDSDDWLVIKHAVLAGLGIASIPEELCPELTAGGLEIVLPDWTLPSTNLHIVYTSRRGLIPAVRSFIDFVAERLERVCQAGTQDI